MDQSTVLIVSDDPDFSRLVTGRWQGEPQVPAFTVLRSDLCTGGGRDTFAVAIVGAVHVQAIPSVLKTLEAGGQPVLVVSDELTAASLRQFPRMLLLRPREGWLDGLLMVVREVLRRVEAQERAQRSEAANTILKRQAVLGQYVLEMRHNLNNALTSVLGNSELLLLVPGTFSATERMQVETIRSMALRMHEILQRFSSLEKELAIAEWPRDANWTIRAQAASTP